MSSWPIFHKRLVIEITVLIVYHLYIYRRSAATLLADCGADIITLKRFGGWKSDNVVQGYIEESIQQKVHVGRKILGENEESTSGSKVGCRTTSGLDMTIRNTNKQNDENAFVKLTEGMQFNCTNCTINVISRK